VIVGTLGYLILRDRPGPEDGTHYVPAAVADDQPAEGTSGISFREVVKRRNFWLVLGAFGPAMLANNALVNNFAPFVTQRGLALSEAAFLLAVLNIAAVVGKLAAGLLADRYGNRLPMVLLTSLGLIGVVILVFAHGAIPLTAGFIALGMSQGLWVMLASGIASEFGSFDFPRAFALASGATVITVMSAPITAYVDEATGSYTVALLVLSAFGVAGVMASALFRDRPVEKLRPV